MVSAPTIKEVDVELDVDLVFDRASDSACMSIIVATMEYLGRLGLLVPRKSKKDRDSSPHRISCSEESRGLKADLTRVIESGLTSSSSTVAIARLDCNTTTTGTFIPRQDVDDDEMEYMEYAKHVHEQARVRFGAPGGRHAWKTLIFWKKRRRTSSTSISTSAASSASTPMSHHHHHHLHHHHHPVVPAAAATPLRKVGRCKSTLAAAPLYCSDGHLDSTMSIRAWYEPMLRGGKLVALHQQDQHDFCNRSPYVPLSAGRRTPRFASPGPLYLV